MPYMNEDHGNEHERGGGCLGGKDQPDVPAPRHEPTISKSVAGGQVENHDQGPRYFGLLH